MLGTMSWIWCIPGPERVALSRIVALYDIVLGTGPSVPTYRIICSFTTSLSDTELTDPRLVRPCCLGVIRNCPEASALKCPLTRNAAQAGGPTDMAFCRLPPRSSMGDEDHHLRRLSPPFERCAVPLARSNAARGPHATDGFLFVALPTSFQSCPALVQGAAHGRFHKDGLPFWCGAVHSSNRRR